ncbi:TPM domain-containing protein [candidate division WOR-3 bacterium]|nr:TPM domain-containing protein [candidate division WOR-3 bacterium]
MSNRRNHVIICISLVSCGALFGIEYPPAPVGSYVLDLADVIDADYELKINQLCEEVEDLTTAEMAVLTIQSFEGEDPYYYATKIGNLWGIGHESEDNGLVMVVAISDRQVFTAAGYGMEQILPDARLEQIYRSILVPRFKRERYGEGIYEAVQLYAWEIQKYYSIKFEGTRGAPTMREGWHRFWQGFKEWFCVGIALIVIIGFIILACSGKGSTGSSSSRSSSFWSSTSSSSSSWSGSASSSSSSFNSGGFGGGSFGGGGAGGGW